jgi:hypothetical protein
MSQNKQTPLISMHPTAPGPLSEEEQRVDDELGRDEQHEIEKPPKNLPQRMKATRMQVKQLIANYRAKFQEEMEAAIREHNEAFIEHPVESWTIEDRIKFFVSWNTPDGLRDGMKKVFRKPLRKMVPYLKRFDWRTYNVVPKFREQEGGTCWAYVATEAFESSLMIQLANYATTTGHGDTFLTDQVVLNVNSTLDRVPPFRGDDGGRHEEAFNHYLEKGIPLNEIKFNDLTKRDRRLPPLLNRRRKTINAVAWDWVLPKPWRTPLDQDALRRIKEALLEHGPLAVMISLDERFQRYGRPRKNIKLAPPRMSLRFPANTVKFKKVKAGKLLLNIPFEGVNIRWSDELDRLVVRFLADKAPKLETRTGKPIKLRPTACDDAVTFEMSNGQQLGFTANNCVEIEKDDDTGEVILHFPANTNARVTRDRATGDLLASFPVDKAPVFKSNEGVVANHFVLLIGWDDARCAWLVQNTHRQWGFQCTPPSSFVDEDTGQRFEASEERGCMYITYGCNKIGQFAAWIEADLNITQIRKTEGLKVRKLRQSAKV